MTQSCALNTLTPVAELIAKLETKFESYRQKGVYLNPRQKRIVNFIKNAQPVKISDIKKSLDDVSPNTLKKDLKYLVEQDVLEKAGQKRGTVYLIK